MDIESNRDDHWLEDRLERVDLDSGEVPIIRSEMRPIIERGNPWQAGTMPKEAAAIIDRLDEITENGTTIVLVTDVEDDPVARVQTAVTAARAAVARGKSVLIVDADVRQIGLSRWMPEGEQECEGFVDVLSYGASVQGVQWPGPEAGIDIVGVGSYRPDGAEIFIDEDLRRFVAQLRSRHDLVFIISAAWMPNDRFHPLLVHVDAAILTLHLDRSLALPVEEVLEYLLGLDVPVVGLYAYAGPDAAEQVVDDIFTSRPIQTIDAAELGARADLEGDETSFADVADDLASELDHDEPAAKAAEDETIALEWQQQSTTTKGPYSSQPRRSHSSTPALRHVFSVAVMAIVVFVGWWAIMTFRDGGSDENQRVTPPTRGAQTAVDAQEMVAATGEQSEAAAGAVDLHSEAATDPVEAATTGDLEDHAQASIPVEVDSQPSVSEPAVAVEKEEAPSQRQEAEVRGVPAATTDAPNALDEALSKSSGSGWALHLFSFPDSAQAVARARRLESEGVGVAIRGADVKDKGRWFRVLVGRFDTKAAAQAARDEAADRFEVDWVGLQRLQ